MLEGREISILNNHELERTLRLDSEFYSKENLELDKRLKTLNANKLTDYTVISDGNHMSISDYFTEKGIPYYRGGDIYNTFIEQSSNPLYIPRSVFGMKTMERSHLKKGDILMHKYLINITLFLIFIACLPSITFSNSPGFL